MKIIDKTEINQLLDDISNNITELDNYYSNLMGRVTMEESDIGDTSIYSIKSSEECILNGMREGMDIIDNVLDSFADFEKIKSNIRHLSEIGVIMSIPITPNYLTEWLNKFDDIKIFEARKMFEKFIEEYYQNNGIKIKCVMPLPTIQNENLNEAFNSFFGSNCGFV